MNYYNKTLEKARKNNISALTLYIAFECSSTIEYFSTIETFERICHRVRQAYLFSNNLPVYTIAKTINSLITEKMVGISNILFMETEDLVKLAEESLSAK